MAQTKKYWLVRCDSGFYRLYPGKKPKRDERKQWPITQISQTHLLIAEACFDILGFAEMRSTDKPRRVTIAVNRGGD